MGAEMEIVKVGMREFRDKLATYLLESETPLAITRHGDTIGYFLPARRNRCDADKAVLREAAARWLDEGDDISIPPVSWPDRSWNFKLQPDRKSTSSGPAAKPGVDPAGQPQATRGPLHVLVPDSSRILVGDISFVPNRVLNL
jgi:hypothetical protein